MSSPLNVLLVEDHDFTRVTVQAALASRGFAVRAHASPREALADTTEFQVAVLDLDLGVGPTGIDLAHALRRDRPQIGLILLTSYADPRLAVTGLPALPPGCAYICKENVADLSSLVEAAFAVARAPFAPRSTPLRLPEGRIPLTDVQIEVRTGGPTSAFGTPTWQLVSVPGAKGVTTNNSVYDGALIGIANIGGSVKPWAFAPAAP